MRKTFFPFLSDNNRNYRYCLLVTDGARSGDDKAELRIR